MAHAKRHRTRTTSDEPIRAVAYVRHSKAKAKPGDTEVGLETQLAGCERAVAAMGGGIVAVERDILSGDRMDRPGLWQAIDRIERGEANAVIVYALDRFGRNQDQQGVAVIAIKQAGGRLLSATENLEEGPIGDFLRSAYSLAAALELAKIRERVKRALNAKFPATGRYKPSFRPPYGYRKTGNGAEATYAVDPDESAIVRRIFTERAAGSGLRTIAAGLTRDGIPTATGGAIWRPDVVKDMLDREVYATGKHPCWQTEVVRGADGVPWREARPVDERYFADFPAFLPLALWERACDTAQRNVWHSRRNDRPAEVGVLRYGFARCAGCGRAMAVTTSAPGNGRPRYQCTSAKHVTRPCLSPASISIDLLDERITGWLLDVMEHPDRADAYRVERRPVTPDPEALAAALDAEREVAAFETQMMALAQNMAFVTGPAAQTVAERMNALNDELTPARAKRDRLAARCRPVADETLTLVPQDVLAAAVLDAVQAMLAAEPEPDDASIVLQAGPHLGLVDVKLSWKAWQAALSVLNVTVTVAQEGSDQPRWAAEMRPRAGIVVSITANGNLSVQPPLRRTWPARAGSPWRSSDPREAVRPV